MSRRVLTPAAAMEIKRLYALEDPLGRKIYSQMEIAAQLGVSETTVFRTVHKRGAYQALPELKTDADADASLAKLQALLAAAKEKNKEGDRMLLEIAAPVKTPDAGYE